MLRRNKIWLIFSTVFSLVLIVACFICRYGLNFFAFFFSLIIPLFLLINFCFLFYWLIKKKRYSLISLSSILIYFLFFNSPVQINIVNDNQINNSFSLMSFNVKGFGATQSVRNLETSDKITSFVKSKNPDIVCFQEFSRFEFQSFNNYPYKFIGYRRDFEKSLQVIYSKYPIIDKGFIDFQDTRNQTIYVDINFEGEITRVYNIHLQSYMLGSIRFYSNLENLIILVDKVNTTQTMQVEQVQIILDHAKMFKGKVVFLGDFNSTQYSSNYKRLKQNKNDSYIESGFGFGSTYPRRNYPFRIDYVLVDSDINVLSHENFNLKISDHEPILVRLAIK